MIYFNVIKFYASGADRITMPTEFSLESIEGVNFQISKYIQGFLDFYYII
jgi:hypothetical protein